MMVAKLPSNRWKKVHEVEIGIYYEHAENAKWTIQQKAEDRWRLFHDWYAFSDHPTLRDAKTAGGARIAEERGL